MVYLKATYSEGEVEVAFEFGRTKLAPKLKVTIPRLELCAVVLGIENARTIKDKMNCKFSTTRLLSFSRVIFGYIQLGTVSIWTMTILVRGVDSKC